MFVRVVESGNFSRSRASWHDNYGEQADRVARKRTWGAALDANIRRVAQTDAGRDFFESASKVIPGLDAAEVKDCRGVSSRPGECGSARRASARLYIVPRLPEFFRRSGRGASSPRVRSHG